MLTMGTAFACCKKYDDCLHVYGLLYNCYEELFAWFMGNYMIVLSNCWLSMSYCDTWDEQPITQPIGYRKIYTRQPFAQPMVTMTVSMVNS